MLVDLFKIIRIYFELLPIKTTIHKIDIFLLINRPKEPYPSPYLSRVRLKNMYVIDDDANQQPLMFHFSCLATQQMHGQHSCSILAKYLRQSKSAGTSDPFSWAAFSQTGQALLISSMQRTSRSWGQSAAEAKRAKRAKTSTNNFIVDQKTTILEKRSGELIVKIGISNRERRLKMDFGWSWELGFSRGDLLNKS